MTDAGPKPKHDLGVLFVHGIGQQARGETLVRAADALVGYFDAYPCSKDQVELEGADLRPESGPARVRLRFRKSPADGAACDRTWLLAESWWAESFLPQRFGELVRWASRSLPYAVLTHVGGILRRRWREFRSAEGLGAKAMQLLPLLAAALLLGISPQIAVAIMLLLLLLSTLALIPLAVLRAPAAWLQAKLAATLGDSSILDSSETNRAAMVERIRRDLRWLAARGVPRVALVAHSQGAALGWEALQDQIPSRVTDFRTFGSGIKKLLQLRVAGRPEKRSFSYAWAAVTAQIAAIVIGIWLATGMTANSVPAAVVVGGAWLVLLFLAFAPTAAIQSLRSSQEPSRWMLVLPGTSTMALAMPLLFAWKGDPRWHWAAALFVSLWAAAFGLVLARALLKRFAETRDRLLMLLLVLLGTALSSVALWWRDGLALQGTICLVVALFWFVLTVLAAATDDPVAWDAVTGSLKARGIRWKDWYATSDPVSAGQFEPLEKDSSEVTNLDQLLADHVFYWSNRDEFVADLAASLAQCAGWTLDSVAGEIKRRRRWRVQVLKASGYVAWLGIAAALWLRAIGASATGGLLGFGTALWFKGLGFRAIGDRLVLFLRDAFLRLPSDTAARLGEQIGSVGDDVRVLVGLVVVVAPILVLRSLVCWRWRQWDDREARRSIGASRFVTENPAAFFWTFSVYLVSVSFFVLPLLAAAAVGVSLALSDYMTKAAPEAPAR